MSPDIVRERRFSSLIAGLLSIFFPGLGQIYKGQVLRAVVWFLATAAGYWLFFLPGLVLHVCCVLGAAFGGAAKERVRLVG